MHVILGVVAKRAPNKNANINTKKVQLDSLNRPRSIPLKMTRVGIELRSGFPIFEPRNASSHAHLIWFPFWEHVSPLLVQQAHHFALRLRVAHFAGGLALAGMYYTNIYLGYETLFGSPGAGPGTRFSRV